MSAEAASPEALPGRLTRALRLSAKMLEAARAGDWLAVAGLESERNRLLDAASLAGVGGLREPQRAQVRILLADCLRVNDQLTAVTGDHVRALGAVLGQLDAVLPDPDPAPVAPPRHPD